MDCNYNVLLLGQVVPTESIYQCVVCKCDDVTNLRVIKFVWFQSEEDEKDFVFSFRESNCEEYRKCTPDKITVSVRDRESRKTFLLENSCFAAKLNCATNNGSKYFFIFKSLTVLAILQKKNYSNLKIITETEMLQVEKLMLKPH